MERQVLEMVLQAKHIEYDTELSTQELREQHKITYHEVWFWFQIYYRDRIHEFSKGIEKLFLL